MVTKLVFLLTIILTIFGQIPAIAQKNTDGARHLQNISSPNGLEGIVTETEETREDNETTYQIPKDKKESDNLPENITENEEDDSTSGERKPPVFRIKL
jgi:hypothetical protein